MERIQPSMTPLTQPWFDACREGALLLQRCADCDHWQFYPRFFCTACAGENLSWERASGAGRVASFSVVRRAVSQAYEAPYVVALIDLAEGPRMMSQVVDCDSDAVTVGQPVKVRFEAWSDEVSMPVFSPDNAGGLQ